MEDILGVIGFFGTILAAIGFSAFRTYLKHQTEMFDRKLFAQSQLTGQTQSEIVTLRQELAQLRDTSTQYDISIQHTLEEIQQRMAHVEDKVRPMAFVSPAGQPEEQARLARSG